jgi:hypothetical protein
VTSTEASKLGIGSPVVQDHRGREVYGLVIDKQRTSVTVSWEVGAAERLGFGEMAGIRGGSEDVANERFLWKGLS